MGTIWSCIAASVVIYVTAPASPTTQCVWNSIDAWDHLNGEYTLDGEFTTDFGTYSYWIRSSLSCPDTTQYIYAPYYDVDEVHYWSINPSMDKSWIVDYPDCGNDNKLAEDPSQCAQGWTVYSDDKNFVDIPLTVSSGQCPILPCGRIQITGSDHASCDQIFSKDFAQNYVYTNTDSSTTYLYFNPYTFKWYCSDTLDIDNCDDDNSINHQYLSSKTDGWTDVSINASFDLIMSNDEKATFECLDTAEPTLSPTNPTKKPTFDPTFDPTSDPTVYPTAETFPPTFSPTSTPTATSLSPTHRPTTAPSNAPSKFPTFPPTRSPTIAPTNTPTESPAQPTRNPTINPSAVPTLPTSAPTHIIYADVDTGVDIDCGKNVNTDNGICYIDCNLHNPGITNLYCRNVDECIINCSKDSCLSNTKITASNALYLEFASTAKTCAERASIYLPDAGNATIIGDTQGTTSEVLKGIKVYSGTNTDHLHIQCNDPSNDGTVRKECYAMEIDAETARYVTIDINNAELNGDPTRVNEAIIRCPTDSDLSPSCIINASIASSTTNLQIYASKGMPQDVVFYSDGTGDYTDTKIICETDESVIQSDNTFIGTACYITLEPTVDPTGPPTREPSMNPTLFPTIEPSMNPTLSPTEPWPRMVPSTDPTMAVLPEHITSIYKTAADSNDNDITMSDNNDSFIVQHMHVAVYIVVSTVIAMLCICLIAIVIWKKTAIKVQFKIATEVIAQSSPNSILSAPSPISQGPPKQHQRIDSSPVSLWLSSAVGLPQYVDLFLKHGYDSIEAIQTINERKSLANIGMVKKGHQTLILEEIRNLRETQNFQDDAVVSMDTKAITTSVQLVNVAVNNEGKPSKRENIRVVEDSSASDSSGNSLFDYSESIEKNVTAQGPCTVAVTVVEYGKDERKVDLETANVTRSAMINDPIVLGKVKTRCQSDFANNHNY